MAIFILADTHLSFCPDSDKPMDVFGSRWRDHSGRLEEHWRRMITDQDTVIIGGDISWGLKLEEAKYDLDWISALPGRKVMLRGNHDLWWKGVTRLNAMYDNIRFLQNDHVYAEGIYICGSRGWLTPDNDDFQTSDEKIYRRELLRLESSLRSAAEAVKAAAEKTEETEGSLKENETVLKTGGGGDARMIGVMHFPPVSDASSHSGFQELFENYGVRDVYYGHIHGEEGFRNALQGEVRGVRYHLVSLDHLNCRPMRII